MHPDCIRRFANDPTLQSTPLTLSRINTKHRTIWQPNTVFVCEYIYLVSALEVMVSGFITHNVAVTLSEYIAFDRPRIETVHSHRAEWVCSSSDCELHPERGRERERRATTDPWFYIHKTHTSGGKIGCGGRILESAAYVFELCHAECVPECDEMFMEYGISELGPRLVGQARVCCASHSLRLPNDLHLQVIV